MCSFSNTCCNREKQTWLHIESIPLALTIVLWCLCFCHAGSVPFVKSVAYSLKSEKAMASYSSTLAWQIPWTEEPGGLQSMGSLRVGHDWATSLSPFTCMHWRRQWHPTPVLLPGKSHGQRILVGYGPWDCKESDTTEWLHFLFNV